MKSPRTSISVGFNDPDEFATELRLDVDRVERRLLRLTVRRRYGEPFVTVSVVATAVVDHTVVKLEHCVGEAFVGHEKTNGLAAKTQALLDKLTQTATALGLEVRAGVFE